jgi:hypothetical protein
MSEKERYLIGPGLRNKLREIIRRVDGMPLGSSAEIPTRLQDMRRGGGGGTTLKVGTFTGSWQTGTFKTVTITGSTNTVSVFNWCNPSVESGTSVTTATRYVIFGNASGTQSAVEIQAATATCSMVIGGVDFSSLPSFNATSVQLLGHEAGCMKWFDVTACSTATAT